MKRERPRNDCKNGDGCSSDLMRNETSEANCPYFHASSVTSSLVTCSASGYSTFSTPKSSKPKPSFDDQWNFYRSLRNFVDSFRHQKKGCTKPSIHPNHHLPEASCRWRAITVLSITFGILAVLHTKTTDYRYNTFMAAEWYWDHNIYVPKESSDENPLAVSHKNTRPSLIAQIVPGAALRTLEDISSRPNRAYARRWGFDFARYDSGRSSNNHRACFDKVAVLNAVLDKQSSTNTTTSDVISYWSHDPRVQYEYILLLPPDSIVMTFDTNIIADMLPYGKLVAIGGWSSSHHDLNSNSDVIAFHLNHRHAEAVAKLWHEMSVQSQVTCGANNDLGMLVTAVATVMEESEDLDDLIAPLSESKDGFIGNRVIKSIPSTVPGPRTALLAASLHESATLLQQTADSVCYRFYPKCEVLPST